MREAGQARSAVARLADGVVLRTEESWTGARIGADPATAGKYLAPGLDRRPADLKTAAETRAPPLKPAVTAHAVPLAARLLGPARA